MIPRFAYTSGLQMRYFMFIDESGNHGLTELNSNFPVFLLCGVLISEIEYNKINSAINDLKNTFWGNKDVILHSRDIRKCQKEFQVLLDLDVKSKFYSLLNSHISDCQFTVVAAAIKRDDYIRRFGRLSNDVYELCLSFIIERAVFYLDDIGGGNKKLDLIIEERGKKEDKLLDEHFQRLLSRGTGYVNSMRLASYNLSIHFRKKNKNINGLQLSDLCAYPLARYVIEPNRANPALEIFFDKIYKKNGKIYGLKTYP